MFYPKSILDTSITQLKSNLDYEPHSAPITTPVSDGRTSPETGRPALVRKKSGEIVKSALKRSHTHDELHKTKAVSFTSSLVRVRSYDKLQCPQSVNGIIPMGIKLINFENDNIKEDKVVALERIELDKDNSIIKGIIRVHNLSFTKEVIIRYTWDHWATFEILICRYLRAIYCWDKPLDQFEFEMVIPTDKRVSHNLEEVYSLKLAIQYKVNGMEYWDNNNGNNYFIEITPNIEVDPDYLDIDCKIINNNLIIKDPISNEKEYLNKEVDNINLIEGMEKLAINSTKKSNWFIEPDSPINDEWEEYHFSNNNKHDYNNYYYLNNIQHHQHNNDNDKNDDDDDNEFIYLNSNNYNSTKMNLFDRLSLKEKNNNSNSSLSKC